MNTFLHSAKIPNRPPNITFSDESEQFDERFGSCAINTVIPQYSFCRGSELNGLFFDCFPSPHSEVDFSSLDPGAIY